MLQHAIDPRGVEGIVGKGQCMRIINLEAQRQAERSRPFGSLRDQFLAGIDADHPSRRSNQLGQRLGVPAVAATDLDDRHAGLQPQQFGALLLLRCQHAHHRIEVARRGIGAAAVHVGPLARQTARFVVTHAAARHVKTV